MLRERSHGNRLGTLGMSSSSANRTLFLMKPSERLSMSPHCVAGPFASDGKSRTARRAGRSPMLQYKIRSAGFAAEFVEGECCVSRESVRNRVPTVETHTWVIEYTSALGVGEPGRAGCFLLLVALIVREREMVDPMGNERSPSVTAAVVKEDEARV